MIDTQPQELTAKQRAYVLARLKYPNAESAAKAVSVSESTGYRWDKLPAVQSALRDAFDGSLQDAARTAVAGMTGALAVLRVIMVDKDMPAGARVMAAGRVLEHGARLAELITMTDRLAEVERRLDAGATEAA